MLPVIFFSQLAKSNHRKMNSASTVIVSRAIGQEAGDSLCTKKDVTLSRSHSDSYRRDPRNRHGVTVDDGLRQTASNDELQNLRVGWKLTRV